MGGLGDPYWAPIVRGSGLDIGMKWWVRVWRAGLPDGHLVTPRDSSFGVGHPRVKLAYSGDGLPLSGSGSPVGRGAGRNEPVKGG